MQEESGLYIIVGMILSSFFAFPIEAVGIVLQIIGLTLVKNNHALFKLAWVLEIMYGFAYILWMIYNGIGNWWWPLDEMMCIVLMIGINKYYENEYIKKVAVFAGSLMGAQIVIIAAKDVLSDYLALYPELFWGINTLFVLALIMACYVLGRCYKEEKNVPAKS